MGYRIIAVVMITFLVTGFGWGKKKDEDEAVKTSSTYTSPSSKASAKTSSTAYSPSSSTRSGVNATEDGEFPTELISTIASGDEETRRARIESLKRLSQALSDMKNGENGGVVANASTASSSSASADTSSNTTYPWGNY